MTAASLDVSQVGVTLGGRRVLTDVSFTVRPGEVVGVVGPNGSGKSTLLRTIAGVLGPTTGRVCIDGADVAATPPRRLARTLAAVLQDTTGDFDLTAQDVVAMGRACYQRFFEPEQSHDREIVLDAMEQVGVTHLKRRRFALMSGGERQRVLIARALAQQPRLLVMDEPTNHLDVRHQFDALALPRALGVTAVIALHDLNLAAHFCDEVHVLAGGRQTRSGPPADVLTPDLLATVYQVTGSVETNPTTGRPHVVFDPDPRTRADW